ncbi:MAG TPA: two-component regulator propeller domain-containing protein [Candidatus Deferrimicrobium sp.]|nr:two-component regulator propeller domain-containing protein [Candidatus Deferrimicrobium sp.]
MKKEKSIFIRLSPTVKILVLLSWFLSNNLFQQDIFAAVNARKNIDFEHITRDGGLSQNNVYSITQDSKGFMWFGTEDGLNMYDGYDFTVHKPDSNDPNKISDSFINCIYEDRSHILWIATGSGGLNRFNRENGTFKHYKNQPGNADSLSGDCVTSIHECSSKPGILWLGTSGGGLNKFDTKKETFTQYRCIPGDSGSLSSDDIYQIYEDRSGVLWIGTIGGGLNRFSCRNGQTVHFQNNPSDPHSLSNNDVFTICEDRKGRLWIGTDNGLNRFDPAKNEFIRYFNDPRDNASLTQDRIRSIFEDHNGTLWVGTLGGGLNMVVEEKDKVSFVHYRLNFSKDNSLNDDDIYCIYEDRFGVLWIGTEGGGLNKVDLQKKPFIHYRTNPFLPHSLSANDIWAIYESKKKPGIFWIGTKGGGLNKFDSQTDTFYSYHHNPGDPNSIGSNSVYALCEDRDGVLWIGTDGNGLNRMNEKSGTFTRYIHDPGDPDSLSGSDVWNILEDRRGFLWIGTPYNGLNRLNRDTGKFTHFQYNPDSPGSIGSNNIWSLFQDRLGVLWVGTDSGLNKFDWEKQTFTLYTHQEGNPNSLSNGRILCIYEDHAGILWIGTLGGGLNKFDRANEKFIRYTEKEGLPNNVINGILEEITEPGSNDYYLWLSSNAGVIQFSPHTGKSKSYNKNDGLQGNEFNAGAFYKSRDGKMFFGGTNGLNCFYPWEIKDNPYIPPVMITHLKVLNKDVKPGDKINGREILTKIISETGEIKLSYDDNVVSFEFAALHYASPRANRYAYRLEGFENNWNYVEDRRFATYTRLTNGDYIFRVKAANNDGLWNEKGTALKITVITPVWRSGWFYIPCALTILFIGLGIHRVRVRGLKNQERKLTQLVQERTQEVEKANRRKSDFLARMSHEIRTPMNSIIGFADLVLETPLTEEQNDFIYAIKQGGDMMLDIINEMLDLSKIEAGLLVLEPVDFEVEIMAFNVCELILPRIEERRIELLCHIIPGVPTIVRGDARRFQQVLTNLMVNAVKFTLQGEVELAIRVEEEEERRVKLLVTVRDTGMGIPRERCDFIFDVLRQGDNSDTRIFEGTGLGLPISKQIAQLMGGDIRVESEPGKGSTFYFTAWMEKFSEVAPGKISLSPVYESIAGKKVLLVDDNLRSLKILEEMLTGFGCRVTAMNGADEAIATFCAAVEKGAPFDLCILDLQMPDTNGYDASTQIRYHSPINDDIPIIAISSSFERRSSKYMETDFDGFVPKPVRRDTLLEMITRLLAKKQDVKREYRAQHAAFSVPENGESTIRILMAEDNKLNRKLAGFLLTKAGYRVDIAVTGKEVVEKFFSDPEGFDLIFMDIQMPEMDGKDAARMIRKNGFTEIPIIAMTASSMKGDREKCVAAGMNDYISKPIKKEDLYKMIKKWVPGKNN